MICCKCHYEYSDDLKKCPRCGHVGNRRIGEMESSDAKEQVEQRIRENRQRPTTYARNMYMDNMYYTYPKNEEMVYEEEFSSWEEDRPDEKKGHVGLILGIFGIALGVVAFLLFWKYSVWGIVCGVGGLVLGVSAILLRGKVLGVVSIVLAVLALIASIGAILLVEQGKDDTVKHGLIISYRQIEQLKQVAEEHGIYTIEDITDLADEYNIDQVSDLRPYAEKFGVENFSAIEEKVNNLGIYDVEDLQELTEKYGIENIDDLERAILIVQGMTSMGIG